MKFQIPVIKCINVWLGMTNLGGPIFTVIGSSALCGWGSNFLLQDWNYPKSSNSNVANAVKGLGLCQQNKQRPIPYKKLRYASTVPTVDDKGKYASHLEILYLFLGEESVGYSTLQTGEPKRLLVPSSWLTNSANPELRHHQLLVLNS